MPINFIHLTTHSEYSVKSSIVRIDKLIELATEYEIPAIALTDHMNVFAAVKFFQKAISNGIKPIIGCYLDVIENEHSQDFYSLTVLCKNQQGYNNLLNILSKAYKLNNSFKKPLVEKRWLLELSDGLIILSGGDKGDIGKHILANKDKKALQALKAWKDVYGENYYLEVTRLNADTDSKLIRKTLIFSDVTNTPLVATNHPLFLHGDEYEAHCVRVCINEGKILSHYYKDVKYSREQYYKHPKEMQKLFADIPQSLDNTIHIAKKCTVNLELDNISLPDFPLPENYTVKSYLMEIAKKGLDDKFAEGCISTENTEETKKIYEKRLSEELSVITSMGYSGYFLIVYDFTRWAKNNNIPVGPGRGSGVGSIVAYSLGITNIDPIKYDLLFERFLNPERVSMPDFDIDFCIVGRDKVIDYVANKYGSESVAQIITFGTLSAKAVVRDVGRALGHPYGLVDMIARLIPMELGITLRKALNEPELEEKYNSDDVVKTILDMSMKLEGITRNVGKHAGGVVIAPGAISQFSAVYKEDIQDSYVTQYDKYDVEQVGLIKFDMLGLKTLTVIDNALKIINDNREEPLDIIKIPLDDKSTYDLICKCNTTAVFQLESRGIKDLISRLQPDKFEDIIALIALFRPGPLQSGMVDDFVDRKHGREPVKYIHPSLESVLSRTYGVILYQEQVMEIARKVGGYTLGKADLLRRAMGKKKPKEMEMQRSTFLSGAIINGLDKKLANTIFDLMEKFSGYGFNKSHAAAYALLTYQTAWLKTNYPAEFMAAVMSCELENTDKLFGLVNECKQIGLTVLAPSVNHSNYKFNIENSDIRFGLGAIKGIGYNVVEEIIRNRPSCGYSSLLDFTSRVDIKKVSKKNMEILAYAGALDCLGASRGSILQNLSSYCGLAEKQQQDAQAGQASLFGSDTSNSVPTSIVQDSDYKMSTKEYLAGEIGALGFYLTIHPMDLYKEDLKSLGILPIKSLYKGIYREKATIAGIITAIKRIVTKRGDPMFFVTVNDGYDTVDVLVFNDVYLQSSECIIKDRIVKLECIVSIDSNKVLRLRVGSVELLQTLRERKCRSIEVIISENDYSSKKLAQLSDILSEQQNGNCSIFLSYDKNEITGKFKLRENLKPSDDMIWNLRNIFGDNSILLKY